MAPLPSTPPPGPVLRPWAAASCERAALLPGACRHGRSRCEGLDGFGITCTSSAVPAVSKEEGREEWEGKGSPPVKQSPWGGKGWVSSCEQGDEIKEGGKGKIREWKQGDSFGLNACCKRPKPFVHHQVYTSSLLAC